MIKKLLNTLAFAAFGILTMNAGAVAPANGKALRADRDAILESAARLVEQFPGDEDAQNDYRFKLAQRYLEVAQIDAVMALTERMGRSHLRGELEAQLALKAAIRGEAPMARAWLDKASKIAVLYQDQWQADRIRARSLVVSDFLGDRDSAQEEVARLKDLESRLMFRVERAVAAVESGVDTTLTMPPEALGNEVKGVPEVLLYPRGILRLARLEMARKPGQRVPEALLALLDLAVEICKKSRVVSTSETIGIAGFLVEHGEKKAAGAALAAALQQLNQTKFDPHAFASVAQVYAAARDESSARRALTDAERMAADRPAMLQPAALAAIACGYARCGDADKADGLLMEALKRAKVNPNPRTAMMAAVDVSLLLYDAGMTAPKDFARELETIGIMAGGATPL